MKKTLRITGLVLGLIVLALSWPAYQLYTEIRKAQSEDPLVWEADIQALEEKTRGHYAPGEAVVFVGSSSIRLWDSLDEDMAPIPVLQHGFGGAKLNDVLHYAPRLVVAYQPRAVVVFAGTNDIDPRASKPPQVLLGSYQELVAGIHSELPGVPIFYIGITPSPMRWEVWDSAQATNQLIADWSATQAGLYFIDTSAALMNAAGKPEPENYVFDGLHLSERGYAIWASLIKPRLLQELGMQPQG